MKWTSKSQNPSRQKTNLGFHGELTSVLITFTSRAKLNTLATLLTSRQYRLFRSASIETDKLGGFPFLLFFGHFFHLFIKLSHKHLFNYVIASLPNPNVRLLRRFAPRNDRRRSPEFASASPRDGHNTQKVLLVKIVNI